MDYGYQYTYQYDYPMHSGGDALFAAILSIYLIVLTVIIIFVLVSYIFHSIGMYTIGKRMGKSYPWLAFVPFARDYFYGELAGEIRLKEKTIKNPGIWNLVLPIIGSVAASIFVVILALAGGIGALAAHTGMGGGAGIAIMLMILLYILLIVLAIGFCAAQMVLTALIDKQIYERFTTGNMAVAHAVLSRAIPLYGAFCMFMMRHRDFNPGMEPKLTPPPAPGAPVYPGTPVPPEAPVQPEAPVTPEPPVQPETPVTPEPPVQPEVSVPTELPVYPEAPCTPSEDTDKTE